MLFPTIRRVKIRIHALHALALAAVPAALAAVLSALWAFLHSLPLAAACTVPAVTVSVMAMVRIARSWRINLSGLYARMEQSLFGKRRLMLDSLEEFRKTGDENRRNAAESALRDLDNLPALRKFDRDSRIRFRVRALSALGILTVSCALVLILFSPMGRALSERMAFLRYRMKSGFPARYLTGSPFVLDFSADAVFFDGLDVIANGEYLESTNGMFAVPEKLSLRPEIVLSVAGTKFGWTREILRANLEATTRLLPQAIRLSVRYVPRGSGGSGGELPMAGEDYAGLQDLEVWENARVSVSGEMTKGIASAELLPDRRTPVRVSGRSFFCDELPVSANRMVLRFRAADGDEYETAPFLVRRAVNRAPELRLLFPAGNVMVRSYPWSVTAVLQGDDDQGIRSIRVETFLSNRNVRLSRYNRKTETRMDGGRSRTLQVTPRFSSAEWDLLPDDVATIRFRAEDVFGKLSGPVSFSIVFPDLLDLREEDNRLLSAVGDRVTDVSNANRALGEDLAKPDANRESGHADQRARLLQDAVSNLSKSVADLAGGTFGNIGELSETLRMMRDVADKLVRNADILPGKISEARNDRDRLNTLAAEPGSLQEYLKELTRLLDELEKMRKVSDAYTQYRITRNLYDRLRSETDPAVFRRTRESYREELNRLRDRTDGTAAELAGQLARESPGLTESDPDSFRKSDELMKQLDAEMLKELREAREKKIRERQKTVERALEELFVWVLFLEDARPVDYGKTSSPDVGKTADLAAIISSLGSSFRIIRPEIENAVGGLPLAPGIRESLTADLDETGRRIAFFLDLIKDYQADLFSDQLYGLERAAAVLYLDLLVLKKAMDQAARDARTGSGRERAVTMNLEDLMRMQAMASIQMQNLMEQMQRQGRLTPELREQMQELARLQEEIRNRLGEMLKNGPGGLMEGGGELNKGMEDIIKDLKSFKIEDKTLEKSRQIEEKLLKSRKSLESKGVSEERKADTARSYDLVPPKANETGQEEKIDWGAIPDKKLSEYYKKLIERYKKR